MKVHQRNSGFQFDSRLMVLAIMAFGAALRFVQYMHNRSLWTDEAALALNLINRSFSQLLLPLDYAQGAPIGFLFVEKFVINLMGNSEYVLRLFPFLCGIVSIFFFYKLTCMCLPARWPVMLALLLFSVSDRLIYYSSEVKQYSTDLSAALAAYLLAFSLLSRKVSTHDVILYGIAGGVLIWFSHPVVFVLTGTGVVLAVIALRTKDTARVIRLAAIFCIWVISFAVLFNISLDGLTKSVDLHDYWSSAFMPLPPKSFSDITWFITSFFEYFLNPAGFMLSGLACILFIIGVISMGIRDREKLFMLFSPVVFTLLASGLGKYPFSGRLVLFLAPFVLILIAEGLGETVSKLAGAGARIYAFVLVVGVLFDPLGSAVLGVFRQQEIENIRPVLNHISEHRQPGDTLYVYHGAKHSFRYYAGKYGLYSNMNIQQGSGYSENWSKYTEDLERLRDRGRVWVLLSHVKKSEEVDEETLFRYMLSSIGGEISSFSTQGAVAYLYETGKPGSRLHAEDAR
jgi:hypothetical protein